MGRNAGGWQLLHRTARVRLDRGDAERRLAVEKPYDMIQYDRVALITVSYRKPSRRGRLDMEPVFFNTIDGQRRGPAAVAAATRCAAPFCDEKGRRVSRQPPVLPRKF